MDENELMAKVFMPQTTDLLGMVGHGLQQLTSSITDFEQLESASIDVLTQAEPIADAASNWQTDARMFEGRKMDRIKVPDMCEKWSVRFLDRPRQRKTLTVTVRDDELGDIEVMRWSHEDATKKEQGGSAANGKEPKNRGVPFCYVCFKTQDSQDDELHSCLASSCTTHYHHMCMERFGVLRRNGNLRNVRRVLCGYHACSRCSRAIGDMGNFLLRCVTCPRAYCDGCLEDGYMIVDEDPRLAWQQLPLPPTQQPIQCKTCIDQRVPLFRPTQQLMQLCQDQPAESQRAAGLLDHLQEMLERQQREHLEHQRLQAEILEGDMALAREAHAAKERRRLQLAARQAAREAARAERALNRAAAGKPSRGRGKRSSVRQKASRPAASDDDGDSEGNADADEEQEQAEQDEVEEGDIMDFGRITVARPTISSAQAPAPSDEDIRLGLNRKCVSDNVGEEDDSHIVLMLDSSDDESGRISPSRHGRERKRKKKEREKRKKEKKKNKEGGKLWPCFPRGVPHPFTPLFSIMLRSK